ncbi:sensor histidine kinase [Oceanispirochaeta sp.]|jgi:signal transduction histidine kinase|uniref:sensor histidine kinase n=1 Tax=Oceanispirochaeta sp. TaxID=2035350 RepID=UPI002619D9D4|nr:sensor histidine kinase [Oceanispirochaeta sp.]MDA3957212.1 sensor histidine kinase [Oceanispirochaeta sp.]
MSLLTAEKDALLFLKHGQMMAILYGCIVLSSYTMVGFLYPSLILPVVNPEIFEKTFIVFMIISFPLSLSLFLIQTSFGAAIILIFRCYLIMIQGYGVGGFYTIKLLLGICLLVETAFLQKRPVNFILSFIFIAGILFSQTFNTIFGHNNLYGSEVFASSEILMIMGFICTVFAVCINLMILQSDKKEEMQKNLHMQKETMKTLAEFNSNLQNYARTIDVESSDRERNRISREIHDISGYIFTNLIALLNAACSIPQDDQSSLSDILITAQKQAKEGLNETRTALRKTRERHIPEEDGVRAINKIITIFQKVTGVKVNVNWGNTPHSFSREINFTLYRTIQEALTNAIRHGLATEITIHFLIENKILHMTIIDNGLGSESVVKGIGLSGMEERIGSLNGQISVNTTYTGGFELNVRIPVNETQSPVSLPARGSTDRSDSKIEQKALRADIIMT